MLSITLIDCWQNGINADARLWVAVPCYESNIIHATIVTMSQWSFCYTICASILFVIMSLYKAANSNQMFRLRQSWKRSHNFSREQMNECIMWSMINILLKLHDDYINEILIYILEAYAFFRSKRNNITTLYYFISLFFSLLSWSKFFCRNSK